MWCGFSLLILCCAVSGLDAREADRSDDPSLRKMLLTEAAERGTPDRDAPSAAKVGSSPRGGEQLSPGTDAPGAEGRAQPTAEPLEDELDNQENIISQLLGDYDKVKTVSSGSDCVCRCIVRPIKRSDCSRIHDSDLASPSRDFYTVETVTKGTDCKKCVCMAPASAVNPCEGEYRFKKLQDASKDDIKLATIIDLLEGSLYGLDLLKLHSVTTKLLTRVDNVEKAFARNFTEKAREKECGKERAKEKKPQQKKKKVNDLERTGQKSGAAAYGDKQKCEVLSQKNPLGSQNDGLEQQQQLTRNKTGTQKPIKDQTEPKQPIKDQTEPKQPIKDQTEPKQPIKDQTEPTQPIKDQTEPKQPIKDQTEPKQPIKDQTEPKQPIKDKNSMIIRGVTFYKAEESYKEEDKEGKGKPTTLSTNVSVDLLISNPLPPTTTFPTKSPGPSTPISTQLDLTTQPTRHANQGPTSLSDINISPPTDASPTAESRPGPKSRLSWTENPADQPKTTKKPAVCKDTLASISEPVQLNSYGLSDGAWMRDARGHGNVIYLTNGHYGNNLLEFRDMDTFKSGQASNSYKLPYSFTGTGHVVFNGAFYYNRAFSRDVIRYDLRHRYVAAWTTLHDALLEEQVHRTQTEVEFAVDESGLWLLYPALDTEGFHQEVILLIHLRPRDLQPIQSFRTGLRRGRYGNSFLVCGVLYAVNSMKDRHANVTYAFDTHTLTHTVPSLAVTNMHAHISQLAYCPLDKKLYAWDNGHQMTYDVVFAY
ncbi:olfactomedin-like protein 2B [Etheostoma spectabile]|uniref:olfactomedin-like protein 2B n=1 Tax=Etheostoma spectabile TaxID=54343 RepID=UPI0013AE91C1|nr:olfactomedin-like protein 2B [Etheostoma spectabile]